MRDRNFSLSISIINAILERGACKFNFLLHVGFTCGLLAENFFLYSSTHKTTLWSQIIAPVVNFLRYVTQKWEKGVFRVGKQNIRSSISTFPISISKSENRRLRKLTMLVVKYHSESRINLRGIILKFSVIPMAVF